MGGIVLATLWTGGKIYTMAQVGETVDAVLVEDGKLWRQAQRRACRH